MGLRSSFGTCPAGSLNVAFGPMLHVWIIDLLGNPSGLEPDEADVERGLASRGG